MNNAISGDFKDCITMDMLNSKEHISITLKPEIEESFRKQQQEDVQVINEPLATEQHFAPTQDPEQGYTNGKDLEAMDERKGWYREGKHGREVEVGEIWAEKVPSNVQQEDKPNSKEQKGDEKFTYRMSAVINGEVITHEISKKQYDKFMAVD